MRRSVNSSAESIPDPIVVTCPCGHSFALTDEQVDALDATHEREDALLDRPDHACVPAR